MKTNVDAVIIGAATAFELSKRGYRTLTVDKLPAAGYGPTSSSCAIVRAHYSTLEGVKMAYEGFSYWQDWPLRDHAELARVNCGTILLKSATGHHEKVLAHYRRLGVEFEEWDARTLQEKVPYFDVSSFRPPSRLSDPAFFEARGTLSGAICTPESGYVNDPVLATDYLPQHFASPLQLPELTADLLELGYRDADVRAILGGNFFPSRFPSLAMRRAGAGR